MVAETNDYIISVLTIGPGNSLSDSFGHSAIRVQDKSKNYDLVFNYGIYDFNDPNFYTNFIKGYLNYSLGVSYYKDFKSSYISNNRSNVSINYFELIFHKDKNNFSIYIKNFI